MRTRLLLLLTTLLTAAMVVLVGGVLREAESDAGRAAEPLDVGATADRAVAGFGIGDTAGTVRRLETALKAEPQDRRSLGLLGLAYLQRTRETGDVAYYSLAERALRRALAGDVRDPIALSGLASLAASRHEFRESLRFARRAVAAAPYTARGYGLVGDALLELGRYEQAFATFDRMVAIKPTLAGYARVAYARELTGRPRAAIEAMELALDAAGPPEPTAWTLVELGKLHFGLGETAAAGRSFRAALFAFPGYAAALDGLARVEAARGRLPQAIRLQRRAVESVPLPHLVAQLGDLLQAAGHEREAREQFALVGAIDRLQAANGVNADLETALFRADHGIRLNETVDLARKARAARPSVQGDDALAWALARAGRCAEARTYSQGSLRLGTKDASFYFHRGMIERCLGNDAAAKTWFGRALETNPHFSLRWSETARRLAA